MRTFVERHRHLSLLVAMLLGQLFFLAYQIKGANDVRLIRLWAIAVVAPVEKVAVGVLDGLGSLWDNYIALYGARQENERLQAELAQARLRLQELFKGSGGFATSLITTLLAFFVAGLVVLATGKNPFSVYRGIFNGTGLNWLFPWVSGDDRAQAAFNLQQTGLLTTTLILTGLAVAFAFRCGLFNIGGQGQWVVGAIVSVWVGSSWADLAGPAHIVAAILLGTLAGALWGGIAGLLRATVGAHEVISTIMLNWIAYWVGTYLFINGGPLQSDVNTSSPISNDIQDDARLPVFWGDKGLQGLHIGLFIALGVLVFYWLILARSTLGFRVRAVGRNPEAAPKIQTAMILSVAFTEQSRSMRSWWRSLLSLCNVLGSGMKRSISLCHPGLVPGSRKENKNRFVLMFVYFSGFPPSRE